MSLKIDSNRNIETADQAEEILFQARLENKRAVVIQTDNGRVIRITKPNNMLTQLLSDLSGQTQREQSQIREFVSSLRERDAKLISRPARGLSNAEDDNTYDAKGELQQAQSLKNRESDVLQMQARENAKK